MIYIFLFFLFLLFSKYGSAEPKLQVLMKVDDTFTPVSSTVEGLVGTHFSLLCELVFSRNESGFDDRISWFKKPQQILENVTSFDNNSIDFENLNVEDLDDMFAKLKPGDVNKAEKRFDSLRLDDTGTYLCFSFKYRRSRVVNVEVRSLEPRTNGRHQGRPSFREMLFCADAMFRCVSNGVCVIGRYVCDGKPDCRDGSDESERMCDGDPCRDKLRCDDGRCIPVGWCCDSTRDLNCTVTNRPKCCQLLLETYEELEFGLPSLSAVPNNNGARYLFISVCVLSLLFSIVLLLVVLSKVILFAKKSALHHNRHEDIPLYQQSRLLRTYRPDFQIYGYRNTTTASSTRTSPHINNRFIILGNCDISDPLLASFPCGGDQQATRQNLADAPPSYRDVINEQVLGICDPPPVYTSREVLNI